MADPKPEDILKTYELKISWMKKENELQSKIIEQLKSLLATPHSRLSPAGSCVQCKTFCNIDHRKYNLVNIKNTTKPSPENSFNPRMLRTIDNLQMKYGLPGKEQKCITVMERQCKQMPRMSCQDVETGDCVEDLPGMKCSYRNSRPVSSDFKKSNHASLLQRLALLPRVREPDNTGQHSNYDLESNTAEVYPN